MALGVKYSATVMQQYFDYQIEILEDGYTGAVILGTLSNPLFTINYMGDADNMHEPMRTSMATVHIYVEKDSDVEDLVNDIIETQEKKYFIKIYRKACGTADAYSVMWRGIVLQDNFVIENDCNYTFELTAVDGIARLKEVKIALTDANNSNIVEGVINMLKQTGVEDLYGADEFFLTTGCRYFEDSFSSLTIDPLAFTKYLPTQVHSIWEVDKPVTYRSYYDVLESICRTFSLRLMHSNGHFWLIHAHVYNIADVIVHRYSKGYNISGNPAIPIVDALQKNVNLSAFGQVNNTIAASAVVGNIEYGSQFLITPALKRVELNYAFAGANIIFNVFQEDITAPRDTGFVSAGGAGQLFVNAHLFTKWDSNYVGTTWQVLTVNYWVKVQVGSSYWNGNAWTTTNTALLVKSTKFTVEAGDQIFGNASLQFSTTSLPSGAIFISAYTTIDTHPVVTPTKVSDLTNATVHLSQTVYQVTERKYIASNTSTNVDSSLVYDYGTTLLGDNPTGSFNNLQVYNGSAWVKSDLWRFGTLVGTKIECLQLTVQLIMQTQNRPNKKLDATVWGGNWEPWRGMFWNVATENYRMVWNSCSYDAYQESWQGTWCVLTVVDTGVANDTPVDVRFLELLNTPARPTNGLGSVIDLGRDYLRVSSSTTDIAVGDFNELEIAPYTGGTIPSGTSISVVNAANGRVIIVTTNAAVEPTDTSISIAGSNTSEPIPAGSAISIVGQNIINNLSLSSGASDAFYEHIQSTASATWTVDHDLNKRPSVTVVNSAGATVIGDVEYTSNNQCVLTFRAAFGGRAYFN